VRLLAEAGEIEVDDLPAAVPPTLAAKLQETIPWTDLTNG
jgi:hypothetical protein